MAHEWEALAQDADLKPLLYRTMEDGREVERTYLRHAERKSEGEEVESMERKLTDPVERRFLQNPGKLKQQNDVRKRNLLAQSPPTDLKPAQRDKLAKLERVTRDFVATNMPSAEQMRHNPPGAVDHHIAWDRAVKPAMLAWKNVRILLNPHSDALDLANFERYRPANAQTRNLFTDGQIGGVFGLSPEARQNYDQIDFSNPEIAAQIQAAIDRGDFKVRVSGTPAQGRAKAAKVKRVMSEAQRAALARAQAARAAKLAAREEVPA